METLTLLWRFRVTKYVALIWVLFHPPLLLPAGQGVQVFLCFLSCSSEVLVSVPSLGVPRAFPVFEGTVSPSEGSFDLWGDPWFGLVSFDGFGV